MRSGGKQSYDFWYKTGYCESRENRCIVPPQLWSLLRNFAKRFCISHGWLFDLEAKNRIAQLHWNKKKHWTSLKHWIKTVLPFLMWWFNFCLSVVAKNHLASRYNFLHECFIIASLFKELYANVHLIFLLLFGHQTKNKFCCNSMNVQF